MKFESINNRNECDYNSVAVYNLFQKRLHSNHRKY